jgi:UDP-N-acetylglucosamine--N-acetylmuramyl-(pentapeptide) pyrophosphoryl-undecaprenol N-acetylglucosamine transferase
MIGYYVHHHGRGHLTRATEIARRLPEPVTVLSSLPRPERIWPFAEWVELARDDAGRSCPDQSAGGALHFAPLHCGGYSQRMEQITHWLTRCRPRLMVIDVSVEVTVLCRVLGTPTLVVALPGVRHDEPHLLGYRLAGHILAPWSGQVYRPAHLRQFDGKCSYVGAFSRFDGQLAGPPPGDRQVLVLFGAGGSDVDSHALALAQRLSPDWAWTVVGGPAAAWTGDVWQRLQASNVVITHGGQNALAEVAASRRAAVIVPQPRPFDEQVCSSRALHRAGIAQLSLSWPEPGRWDQLLAAALRRGGARWSRWSDGRGASRAAAVVSQCIDYA